MGLPRRPRRGPGRARPLPREHEGSGDAGARRLVRARLHLLLLLPVHDPAGRARDGEAWGLQPARVSPPPLPGPCAGELGPRERGDRDGREPPPHGGQARRRGARGPGGRHHRLRRDPAQSLRQARGRRGEGARPRPPAHQGGHGAPRAPGPFRRLLLRRAEAGGRAPALDGLGARQLLPRARRHAPVPGGLHHVEGQEALRVVGQAPRRVV